MNHADIDVLELDLGLARLQPSPVAKLMVMVGRLLQDRLHGEPAADQHGDERHRAIELQPPARAVRGDGFGNVGFVGRLAMVSSPVGSQIRRGSKDIAANIVSTTTDPNAIAAGPAWMVASALNARARRAR